MSHKKPTLILAALSLVFLIGSYYLANNLGLVCVGNDVSCENYYANSLAQPIFFFSASILLSVIFLLFSSEDTYKRWRRFALWAIPISIIVLYLAPSDSATNMVVGKDFSKETASWGVSFIFLLTSLIIIMRPYFSNRNVHK